MVTLAGEIDLESAPLVRMSLEECLRDGIRAIDVDLTHVTFCDCSGLNTFLSAAEQTTAVGGTVRLHHPPPTLALILDLVGCGSLLLGTPPAHFPASLRDTPVPPAPVPQHGSVQLVSVPLISVLLGDGR
ncbi:hypothetical protein GCM10023084_64530 [Streptomyces lacrimifluminis]|uniref:Anti-sigma factor antagonist n=1 Tax=Streptomyces lacrimifluminis TaxID=1500077 RepID=A0A917LBH5_9ACTN|nr:hypothetical protein GCM10012282_64820 [Streptomyces lacrimifluminis]